MAQIGDRIHEDVCSMDGVNAGTHTEPHSHDQVKPQIPKGLLSALYTWRLLISGCLLTPFNRIFLVLGFLCSVEDVHAISQGRE